MRYIYTMKPKKVKTRTRPSIFLSVSEECKDMLNQSQCYLKMRPAQIVREAVVKCLEGHLPKEAKEEILKKGRV